jgi:catechol 2,3-dioxygenase-like lactoylglutathione lyase family enzyme
MSDVTGSHHTGFHVSDLERSLGFYRDLLGLELLATRVIHDDYVARIVGYPGVELHSAFLRVPGSEHLIELMDYRNVDRRAVDTANANPGTAHLCLTVERLRPLFERLRAAGVEAVSDPVLVTHGPNEGRLAVYLLDPDGIRIELLQLEREPA